MSITNDTAARVNKHLYHGDDVDTSRTAAEAIDADEQSKVKQAIIDILTEEPRTVAQVQGVYFARRADNDWPWVKFDSVDKRMSELGKEGRIRRSGATVTSEWNRPVHVWEVTPAPTADPMPTILDILGMKR